MWIFEFKTAKLKSYFPFLNPQSTLYIPQLCRHFSLGQQHVLFALALFILGILYFKFYYHPSLPPEETFTEFVIEVSGEVRNPGIYIFRSAPAFAEAIETAGGVKEASHFDMDSSSMTIKTGMLLTLIKESDQQIKVRLGKMEAKKLLVFSIPLDLNQVSVPDLCLIPGIGESLAQEIVSYREKRKGFLSVEELENVPGIGTKKFQTIRTFFTLKP